MSVHESRDFRHGSALPGRIGSCGEVHWVEVFKERITEDLKAVFQDDMDWSTSFPILNLLNKLQKIEDERRESSSLPPANPALKREEQTLDPARSP